MEQIYHFFNVKIADANQAFLAINTAEGIQKWWTSGTEKKDNVFIFSFGENNVETFKVLNAVEPKTIEWQCTNGSTEWIGTIVEFKIEVRDDATIDISFRHYNWAEQTKFYAICNYHWGLFMKSLKLYLETGTGTPHNY